jgi:hypothetical protein
MAEVAHALRQALRSKTERAMFIEIYRGTCFRKLTRMDAWTVTWAAAWVCS